MKKKHYYEKTFSVKLHNSNYELILLVKVNIYHIDDYIICIMFLNKCFLVLFVRLVLI